MAVYLTGRTRTATYVAHLTFAYLTTQRPNFVADPDPSIQPLWSCSAPWGATATMAYWADDVAMPPGQLDYKDVRGGADYTFTSGYGTPLTIRKQYFGPNEIAYHNPSHPGLPESVVWSRNYDITVTMTCDLEEIVDFGYGNGAPDSFGFPLYGGPNVLGDMPQESTIGIYWRPRAGGSATCSVSGVGVQSGTITPGGAIGYQIGVSGHEDVYQATDTLNASWTIQGGGTGIDSYVHSVSGSDYSAAVSAGGSSFSLTATSASSGFTECTADCNVSAAPQRSFVLGGVIKAMQNPYPDSLTVTARLPGGLTHDITATGGAWGDSQIQRLFSIGSTLAGVAQPTISVNELTQIQQWLKGTGLTSNSEDIRLWRILMTGYSWDAVSISQAGAFYPDPASRAADWAAGPNTTVSGTPVTITVSGVGPGSVTSTLPHPDAALVGSSWSGVSFAGARYMQLYLTTAAVGATAKVTLVTPTGSKFWIVTVPASGFVELDLRCPTSNATASDTTDGKWPYSSVAPAVVRDGPLTGVSNVTQVKIEGLAASTSYSLTAIKLSRKQHATVTTKAPMPGWVLAVPPVTSAGVTTTTMVRRFLQGSTDYRPSLELADITWTETAGSSTGDTYSPAPIFSLVSAINGSGGAYPSDGWAATDLRPRPSTGCPDGSGNSDLTCLLNSDQPSTLLCGDGWYFRAGAWHHGFDISVAAPVTLPAQLLLDTIVDWPPDPFCGDAFGLNGSSTGSTGSLTLYGRAVLRGTVQGTCHDNLQQPVAGATVSLARATGGASGGSGVTDAIGGIKDSTFLSTGLPAGKGMQAYLVSSSQTPAITPPTITLTSRKRHHCSFANTNAAGSTVVWLLRDYTGRLMIFGTDAMGRFRVNVYDDHDASPAAYTVDPAVGAKWPCFHLNGDAIEGTYCIGTTPWWIRSNQHGRIWMAATPVPFPVLWTAGYTFVCSVQHRGRLVVLGHHKHDPANTSDGATAWYCTVGNQQPDGSYAWPTGGPVNLGLTDFIDRGSLEARDDGVLEFCYLTTAGAETVVRCRALALDATGTWG